MKNLSSGALPAEIVSDIGRQMQQIKTAIATLEAQEPPKDYTSDQIRAWLNSIKAAPTEAAVKLLIERIQVIKDTTSFNIESTLKEVVGLNGQAVNNALEQAHFKNVAKSMFSGRKRTGFS